MTRRFKFSLLSVSILALSTGAAFADYQLNILHINDFHSRIDPINKYDATCSADEESKNQCFGGAARLKTAFDQRRAALAGQNVLVLNAGDNFQGSLFYTTYKGTAELDVMNAIGFDAMTVGNHEFDDGERALAPFLDKIGFPVLGANVVADSQSTLGDRIKPSTVVEIGGQKIGIIGAITPDTAELASPGPHVSFTDDVAAIAAEAQKLKAEGVNKIVALTHVGYNRDIQAIAKIPEVDVVVGGHSHTLLSNADAKAAGPYPTMVDNPEGYQVPVVTAGAYGKYLGDLVVTFDDDGVVKSAKGDPIVIDSSFAADPAVTARVAELAQPIAEMRKKVIGASAAPIDGAREVCRTRECPMGDLVADALVDRTKGQGVTIAITNGGGLRASIDAGDVTQGEVITVLPFQNTVATFELTGADIRAALENGVSQIDDGAGRFPQVSGLKFSFDRSKPAGSRVGEVEVGDGGGFAPLDPGKTYTLASNNYMRAGGDGYGVFAKKGMNAYDYGPDLADVTADYIAAHSPYQPYTDGRIVETTPAGYVAPAAQPATAAAAAVVEANKPATPAATAAAPTAAASAATAPVVAATAPSTTLAAAPAATAMPTATAPAAAVPAVVTPKSVRAKTHTVVKGESLWKIAREVYGDGGDWRKIARANKLRHPHHVEVGKVLMLPAD